MIFFVNCLHVDGILLKFAKSKVMVGSLNRMWNRILLREDDADAPVSDIKSAADLLPHFRDLRRVVLLAQQHNLFHLQGVPPLNGYSVDQSGD